jgi:hypothetical protein
MVVTVVPFTISFGILLDCQLIEILIGERHLSKVRCQFCFFYPIYIPKALFLFHTDEFPGLGFVHSFEQDRGSIC